ncbi:MAG: class I SAM-dependent methyltransferase [Acidimicrobiales bacterium]|nr:class I SAM-dependent methyltransferase [Acidimicrobiales bacterium]
MTEPDWAALDAAWEPARAAGILGGVTLEDIRQHAAGFVPAACGVFDGRRLLGERRGVDLGSGAGVPGVVLALEHPDSTWLLVDSNERRCSLLHRVVRDLGLGERVEVLHARAEDVAHDADHRAQFDVAVARLFGPAADVAECAIPLVNEHGVVVVSASSDRENWTSVAARSEFAVVWRDEPTGTFVELTPTMVVPATWPRRPNARQRTPLF